MSPDTPPDMPAAPPARTLSLVVPSGHLTLGNLLGAIRQWIADQRGTASLYGVADMHALTVEHDPAGLRALTVEQLGLLIAAGLDPDRCVLFVQSRVPAHAELHWLLEATAHVGELRRMTQFKQKAAEQASVRAALLTYPALMAADILLYDVADVPVGDDQRQHLELARDLAIRFNAAYGETFTVPRAVTPPVAARVMDLQDPGRKMSKSTRTEPGVVRLLDPPDVVRRKISRAVTDAGTDVRFDAAAKPGVSNLLEILAAVRGVSPDGAATGLSSYAALKRECADAVIATLEPLQRAYAALDPREVEVMARDGSARAAELAAPVLARARAAIGLTAGQPSAVPAGYS